MSDREPTLHLSQALEQALHVLNSGGVPVVLSRHASIHETRDGQTLRHIRVYEVRLRWTQYPHVPGTLPTSQRSPMITEVRHRASNAWSDWETSSRPFSVDDLQPWAYWSVRYPGHPKTGNDRCRGCEHDEDVTDAELEQIHGKGPTHTCALRLYEDH